MTDPHGSQQSAAVVFAGVPAVNNALYHQLRFSAGDPAALIRLPGGERILIIRDIEMHRARQHARVDRVTCPADFPPDGGLSGDRETATAQAVAECLVRHGIRRVIADRSLPLIFADEMRQRQLEVECDRDLGVLQRRQKDEQEIAWLHEAQSVTEGAIELACRMIAAASATAEGWLEVDGARLTAERVRSAVDVWLLERGYSGPAWIIAGGPQAADCHEIGTGPLQTGQPVIVDIFPQNRATRYHGDCTRTVVHGKVSESLAQMHSAVVSAKQGATEACRAGVTGQAVHEATAQIIEQHGYSIGLPAADAPPEYCAMVHGTGHGIGLEVHEPPLLDRGGPALLVGDALTIEPGLYSQGVGGVRVEDMVIVEADGCQNLNRLPEGLSWDA